MLLRNLNVKNGLCNGTRLQVMEMGKNLITARILTGNNEGSIATIPRINLQPNQSKFSFKMIRSQFPIMPAFAMTINKSQGQSFSKVSISLTNSVFAHGQLYVALSRTRYKAGLKIFIKENQIQGKFGTQSILTRNIVYSQVIDYKENQILNKNSKVQNNRINIPEPDFAFHFYWL